MSVSSAPTLPLAAAAGGRLDGAEDRLEDVRVVVGLLVLQDGGEALEAHARVDVLVRQLAQTVGLAVKLDKDVVPDLDHVGEVSVHESGGITAADAIVVDLRARAAGAGLAHLPEVVLAAEGRTRSAGRNCSQSWRVSSSATRPCFSSPPK